MQSGLQRHVAPTRRGGNTTLGSAHYTFLYYHNISCISNMLHGCNTAFTVYMFSHIASLRALVWQRAGEYMFSHIPSLRALLWQRAGEYMFSHILRYAHSCGRGRVNHKRRVGQSFFPLIFLISKFDNRCPPPRQLLGVLKLMVLLTAPLPPPKVFCAGSNPALGMCNILLFVLP